MRNTGAKVLIGRGRGCIVQLFKSEPFYVRYGTPYLLYGRVRRDTRRQHMDGTIAIKRLSAINYLTNNELSKIQIAKIGDRLIQEAIYKTIESIAWQLGTQIYRRKELSDRQRRKCVRVRIGGHSYYLKGIKRSVQTSGV